MVPMMRTLAIAAAGTLLLAGCATSQTVPPLAGDHPANPNAAESPLPARSQTLALAPTSVLPHADEPMAGMHHHGTEAIPGVQHESPSTQPDHAEHGGRP